MEQWACCHCSAVPSRGIVPLPLRSLCFEQTPLHKVIVGAATGEVVGEIGLTKAVQQLS